MERTAAGAVRWLLHRPLIANCGSGPTPAISSRRCESLTSQILDGRTGQGTVPTGTSGGRNLSAVLPPPKSRALFTSDRWSTDTTHVSPMAKQSFSGQALRYSPLLSAIPAKNHSLQTPVGQRHPSSVGNARDWLLPDAGPGNLGNPWRANTAP